MGGGSSNPKAVAADVAGDAVQCVAGHTKSKIRGAISFAFGATVTDLKEKSRPLIIVIENEGKPTYKLKRRNFKLDSGKVFKCCKKATIGTGEAAAFGFCNRDGAFMTGVSGEFYFEITDYKNGTYWACIGFSNPYSGGYKGKVCVRKSFDGRESKNSYNCYAWMENNNPQHTDWYETSWDLGGPIAIYTIKFL